MKRIMAVLSIAVVLLAYSPQAASAHYESSSISYSNCTGTKTSNSFNPGGYGITQRSDPDCTQVGISLRYCYYVCVSTNETNGTWVKSQDTSVYLQWSTHYIYKGGSYTASKIFH